MDVTTLRIAATLLSFAGVVGLLGWAYYTRRGPAFEDAGRVAVEQD